MLNTIVIVLDVARGALPDRHDPAALGTGERPVRHVRRRRHASPAAPPWNARLDRITVATAVLFGLCTFWLAWRWNP